MATTKYIRLAVVDLAKSIFENTLVPEFTPTLSKQIISHLEAYTQAGGDLNHQDIRGPLQGNTLFHIACAYGLKEVVDFLFEHKADFELAHQSQSVIESVLCLFSPDYVLETSRMLSDALRSTGDYPPSTDFFPDNDVLPSKMSHQHVVIFRNLVARGASVVTYPSCHILHNYITSTRYDALTPIHVEVMSYLLSKTERVVLDDSYRYTVCSPIMPLAHNHLQGVYEKATQYLKADGLAYASASVGQQEGQDSSPQPSTPTSPSTAAPETQDAIDRASSERGSGCIATRHYQHEHNVPRSLFTALTYFVSRPNHSHECLYNPHYPQIIELFLKRVLFNRPPPPSPPPPASTAKSSSSPPSVMQNPNQHKRALHYADPPLFSTSDQFLLFSELHAACPSLPLIKTMVQRVQRELVTPPGALSTQSSGSRRKEYEHNNSVVSVSEDAHFEEELFTTSGTGTTRTTATTGNSLHHHHHHHHSHHHQVPMVKQSSSAEMASSETSRRAKWKRLGRFIMLSGVFWIPSFPYSPDTVYIVHYLLQQELIPVKSLINPKNDLYTLWGTFLKMVLPPTPELQFFYDHHTPDPSTKPFPLPVYHQESVLSILKLIVVFAQDSESLSSVNPYSTTTSISTGITRQQQLYAVHRRQSRPKAALVGSGGLPPIPPQPPTALGGAAGGGSSTPANVPTTTTTGGHTRHKRERAKYPHDSLIHSGDYHYHDHMEPDDTDTRSLSASSSTACSSASPKSSASAQEGSQSTTFHPMSRPSHLPAKPSGGNHSVSIDLDFPPLDDGDMHSYHGGDDGDGVASDAMATDTTSPSPATPLSPGRPPVISLTPKASASGVTSPHRASTVGMSSRNAAFQSSEDMRIDPIRRSSTISHQSDHLGASSKAPHHHEYLTASQSMSQSMSSSSSSNAAIMANHAVHTHIIQYSSFSTSASSSNSIKGEGGAPPNEHNVGESKMVPPTTATATAAATTTNTAEADTTTADQTNQSNSNNPNTSNNRTTAPPHGQASAIQEPSFQPQFSQSVRLITVEPAIHQGLGDHPNPNFHSTSMKPSLLTVPSSPVSRAGHISAFTRINSPSASKHRRGSTGSVFSTDSIATPRNGLGPRPHAGDARQSVIGNPLHKNTSSKQSALQDRHISHQSTVKLNPFCCELTFDRFVQLLVLIAHQYTSIATVDKLHEFLSQFIIITTADANPTGITTINTTKNTPSTNTATGTASATAAHGDADDASSTAESLSAEPPISQHPSFFRQQSDLVTARSSNPGRIGSLYPPQLHPTSSLRNPPTTTTGVFMGGPYVNHAAVGGGSAGVDPFTYSTPSQQPLSFDTSVLNLVHIFKMHISPSLYEASYHAMMSSGSSTTSPVSSSSSPSSPSSPSSSGNHHHKHPYPVHSQVTHCFNIFTRLEQSMTQIHNSTKFLQTFYLLVVIDALSVERQHTTTSFAELLSYLPRETTIFSSSFILSILSIAMERYEFSFNPQLLSFLVFLFDQQGDPSTFTIPTPDTTTVQQYISDNQSILGRHFKISQEQCQGFITLAYRYTLSPNQVLQLYSYQHTYPSLDTYLNAFDFYAQLLTQFLIHSTVHSGFISAELQRVPTSLVSPQSVKRGTPTLTAMPGIPEAPEQEGSSVTPDHYEGDLLITPTHADSDHILQPKGVILPTRSSDELADGQTHVTGVVDLGVKYSTTKGLSSVATAPLSPFVDPDTPGSGTTDTASTGSSCDEVAAHVIKMNIIKKLLYQFFLPVNNPFYYHKSQKMASQVLLPPSQPSSATPHHPNTLGGDSSFITFTSADKDALWASHHRAKDEYATPLYGFFLSPSLIHLCIEVLEFAVEAHNSPLYDGTQPFSLPHRSLAGSNPLAATPSYPGLYLTSQLMEKIICFRLMAASYDPSRFFGPLGVELFTRFIDAIDSYICTNPLMIHCKTYFIPTPYDGMAPQYPVLFSPPSSQPTTSHAPQHPSTYLTPLVYHRFVRFQFINVVDLTNAIVLISRSIAEPQTHRELYDKRLDLATKVISTTSSGSLATSSLGGPTGGFFRDSFTRSTSTFNTAVYTPDYPYTMKLSDGSPSGPSSCATTRHDVHPYQVSLLQVLFRFLFHHPDLVFNQLLYDRKHTMDDTYHSALRMFIDLFHTRKLSIDEVFFIYSPPHYADLVESSSGAMHGLNRHHHHRHHHRHHHHLSSSTNSSSDSDDHHEHEHEHGAMSHDPNVTPSPSPFSTATATTHAHISPSPPTSHRSIIAGDVVHRGGAMTSPTQTRTLEQSRPGGVSRMAHLLSPRRSTDNDLLEGDNSDDNSDDAGGNGNADIDGDQDEHGDHVQTLVSSPSAEYIHGFHSDNEDGDRFTATSLSLSRIEDLSLHASDSESHSGLCFEKKSSSNRGSDSLTSGAFQPQSSGITSTTQSKSWSSSSSSFSNPTAPIFPPTQRTRLDSDKFYDAKLFNALLRRGITQHTVDVVLLLLGANLLDLSIQIAMLNDELYADFFFFFTPEQAFVTSDGVCDDGMQQHQTSFALNNRVVGDEVFLTNHATSFDPPNAGSAGGAARRGSPAISGDSTAGMDHGNGYPSLQRTSSAAGSIAASALSIHSTSSTYHRRQDYHATLAEGHGFMCDPNNVNRMGKISYVDPLTQVIIMLYYYRASHTHYYTIDTPAALSSPHHGGAVAHPYQQQSQQHHHHHRNAFHDYLSVNESLSPGEQTWSIHLLEILFEYSSRYNFSYDYDTALFLLLRFSSNRLSSYVKEVFRLIVDDYQDHETYNVISFHPRVIGGLFRPSLRYCNSQLAHYVAHHESEVLKSKRKHQKQVKKMTGKRIPDIPRQPMSSSQPPPFDPRRSSSHLALHRTSSVMSRASSVFQHQPFPTLALSYSSAMSISRDSAITLPGLPLNGVASRHSSIMGAGTINNIAASASVIGASTAGPVEYTQPHLSNVVPSHTAGGVVFNSITLFMLQYFLVRPLVSVGALHTDFLEHISLELLMTTHNSYMNINQPVIEAIHMLLAVGIPPMLKPHQVNPLDNVILPSKQFFGTLAKQESSTFTLSSEETHQYEADHHAGGTHPSPPQSSYPHHTSRDQYLEEDSDLYADKNRMNNLGHAIEKFYDHLLFKYTILPNFVKYNSSLRDLIDRTILLLISYQLEPNFQSCIRYHSVLHALANHQSEECIDAVFGYPVLSTAEINYAKTLSLKQFITHRYNGTLADFRSDKKVIIEAIYSNDASVRHLVDLPVVEFVRDHYSRGDDSWCVILFNRRIPSQTQVTLFRDKRLGEFISLNYLDIFQRMQPPPRHIDWARADRVRNYQHSEVFAELIDHGLGDAHQNSTATTASHPTPSPLKRYDATTGLLWYILQNAAFPDTADIQLLLASKPPELPPDQSFAPDSPEKVLTLVKPINAHVEYVKQLKTNAMGKLHRTVIMEAAMRRWHGAIFNLLITRIGVHHVLTQTTGAAEHAISFTKVLYKHIFSPLYAYATTNDITSCVGIESRTNLMHRHRVPRGKGSGRRIASYQHVSKQQPSPPTWTINYVEMTPTNALAYIQQYETILYAPEIVQLIFWSYLKQYLRIFMYVIVLISILYTMFVFDGGVSETSSLFDSASTAVDGVADAVTDAVDSLD